MQVAVILFFWEEGASCPVLLTDLHTVCLSSLKEEETEALNEDGSKEAHNKSVRCIPSAKSITFVKYTTNTVAPGIPESVIGSAASLRASEVDSLGTRFQSYLLLAVPLWR